MEKNSEEADLAEKIRALTMEAINKARSLTRGLYPVNLDIHGFKSAIKELVQSIGDVFGVNGRFECTDQVIFHDNTAATHLYYIIQEAVHNAIKHSCADTITVAISDRNGQYRISVQDNGTGVMEKPAGIGLRIMGLRAKKIGADFTIRSRPAEGTCVEINLRKHHQPAGGEHESA